MEPVKNPHDRFFKETFSRAEVALDFVYNYVPQPIAGLVAPETFKLSKDTFVGDSGSAGRPQGQPDRASLPAYGPAVSVVRQQTCEQGRIDRCVEGTLYG